MNEEKVCHLCGESLKKRKGQNLKAHTYELQHGAHINCLNTHRGILEKHRLSPNEYIGAVINGLFELFPEMNETKAMKDYNSRKKKAEEEIEKIFPYLKKKKKGKNEEKNDEAVE